MFKAVAFAVIASLLACAAVGDDAVHSVVHGLVKVPPKGIADVARLIVNGGEHVVYAERSGAFTLPRLAPGQHTVSVALENIVYPQFTVEVAPRGNNRYRVFNEAGRVLANTLGGSAPRTVAHDDNDDEDDAIAAHVGAGSQQRDGRPVVVLEPLGSESYFVPREKFSIMSIFGNPMILMMAVSMGLMYLMPKMVDPEEMKKQLKEMEQAKDKPAAAEPQPSLQQKKRR